MTRVAILGASGHIGRSLAAAMGGFEGGGAELFLYARKPDAVADFVSAQKIKGAHVLEIGRFGIDPVDVVINAVGAGDPARVQALDSGIFHLTEEFDNRVLDYLGKRPEALYVNMSSGAVYGSDFAEPARDNSVHAVPVNRLEPSRFYSIAKLNAEAKHRAHPGLNIVDLRVFSYFSRFIDISGRFFMAELARALMDKQTFVTTPVEMDRDHLVPADMVRLIECVIGRWRSGVGPVNAALDCYTLAPSGKFELLEGLKSELGLRYEISGHLETLAPTGAKSRYYSTSRRAAEWGYRPRFTTIEGVLSELRALHESE